MNKYGLLLTILVILMLVYFFNIYRNKANIEKFETDVDDITLLGIDTDNVLESDENVEEETDNPDILSKSDNNSVIEENAIIKTGDIFISRRNFASYEDDIKHVEGTKWWGKKDIAKNFSSKDPNPASENHFYIYGWENNFWQAYKSTGPGASIHFGGIASTIPLLTRNKGYTPYIILTQGNKKPITSVPNSKQNYREIINEAYKKVSNNTLSTCSKAINNNFRFAEIFNKSRGDYFEQKTKELLGYSIPRSRDPKTYTKEQLDAALRVINNTPNCKELINNYGSGDYDELIADLGEDNENTNEDISMMTTLTPKVNEPTTIPASVTTTTTLAPANTTTLAPANTTTLAPSNTTTLAPSNTTTLAPDNTTTLAPANTTTLTPDNTTTLAPTTTLSVDGTMTTMVPTTTLNPDGSITTTLAPSTTINTISTSEPKTILSTDGTTQIVSEKEDISSSKLNIEEQKIPNILSIARSKVDNITSTEPKKLNSSDIIDKIEKQNKTFMDTIGDYMNGVVNRIVDLENRHNHTHEENTNSTSTNEFTPNRSTKKTTKEDNKVQKKLINNANVKKQMNKDVEKHIDNETSKHTALQTSLLKKHIAKENKNRHENMNREQTFYASANVQDDNLVENPSDNFKYKPETEFKHNQPSKKIASAYGWSYMPPQYWSVPQQRPPVCIPSKKNANSVLPIYDKGTPVNALDYTKVGSILPKFEYNEVYNPNYYYPGWIAQDKKTYPFKNPKSSEYYNLNKAKPTN